MCKRFPPPRWRHTAGIRRAERERKKGGRNIKSKRGNEYIDDVNLLVLWNTKRDNKLLCISKGFAVDFTSWIRIKTNERSSWTVSWTYFQYVVLQGARLDLTWTRLYWLQRELRIVFEKICCWTFHWWLALMDFRTVSLLTKTRLETWNWF